MRKVVASLLALVPAAALLAGALTVEIGNPATNPEAKAKHAVLLARTTACHSPEQTVITATAEGVVDGSRRSIPLKVITLSTPGVFAVTHEWPAEGNWAIKVVAKNPEYKDFATGAVVAVNGDSVDWASVKHYYHQPTTEELAAALNR